jgi:hypothetical protein
MLHFASQDIVKMTVVYVANYKELHRGSAYDDV